MGACFIGVYRKGILMTAGATFSNPPFALNYINIAMQNNSLNTSLLSSNPNISIMQGQVDVQPLCSSCPVKTQRSAFVNRREGCPSLAGYGVTGLSSMFLESRPCSVCSAKMTIKISAKDLKAGKGKGPQVSYDMESAFPVELHNDFLADENFRRADERWRAANTPSFSIGKPGGTHNMLPEYEGWHPQVSLSKRLLGVGYEKPSPTLAPVAVSSRGSIIRFGLSFEGIFGYESYTPVDGNGDKISEDFKKKALRLLQESYKQLIVHYPTAYLNHQWNGNTLTITFRYAPPLKNPAQRKAVEPPNMSEITKKMMSQPHQPVSAGGSQSAPCTLTIRMVF